MVTVAMGYSPTPSQGTTSVSLKMLKRRYLYNITQNKESRYCNFILNFDYYRWAFKYIKRLNIFLYFIYYTFSHIIQYSQFLILI